jgi:ribosomal protein S18 acetylase RimI-like enzyme
MMPDDDRLGAGTRPQLRILAFEPSHAEAFRILNLDWIEAYFAVEELDRLHLNSPRESFIDTGGAILMAELNGEIVGCCGLLSHGDGVYEVSKMAVKRGYQGTGIGRNLLAEMIEYARSVGAHRLEIISSTRLAPAIHLYRQMGFREVPLESDVYARGNIALALQLTGAD